MIVKFGMDNEVVVFVGEIDVVVIDDWLFCF